MKFSTTAVACAISEKHMQFRQLVRKARINTDHYELDGLPNTAGNVSKSDSKTKVSKQLAIAYAAYQASLAAPSSTTTTTTTTTTTPTSTSNVPTLTEVDSSPAPTNEEGNNTSPITSSSRLVSYYNSDDDDDDSSSGGSGSGDDDGNDPAERDESGFIGGLLSGIGGFIDDVLDGIRKCCCPGDVTGEASTKRDNSGQAVSRVDVAAAAEPHVFDIAKSKGIISSVIAEDNPTLEDIEDAMKHLDRCMKNCEDSNALLEFEQFKCSLLVKFIPKQLAVKPSIQPGYLTGSLSKEDEKNEKKKLTKWSAPLISAVSSLHKSIETLEESERYTATQIGPFKTSHARYLNSCIEEIKPSTTSNSSYRLVRFMNDNYVHTNLSNVANDLMASNKSSRRVVEILQEKLDLLERALAGLDPTSDTMSMSDTDFLEEWNRLEEAEVEAVKQVVCTEGVTARVKDVDTGERITINVVMPNKESQR